MPEARSRRWLIRHGKREDVALHRGKLAAVRASVGDADASGLPPIEELKARIVDAGAYTHGFCCGPGGLRLHAAEHVRVDGELVQMLTSMFGLERVFFSDMGEGQSGVVTRLVVD